MNVLVTGANGFLGRYVVAEALRRGHRVRAMVRSAADAAKHGWDGNPNVEIVQADLRRRKGLADALRGVDVVLHLAASKAGDMYAQYAGTVVATENLLAAMGEAGVRRIVSISSFSVYDYRAIRTWSVLDENSPVEADAFDRDEYAHTKLVQEQLVRDVCTQNGWDYTILRPGVIYGADNLWTARLGVKGERVWIRMGAWARLPLTYVENCASAIVLAAERDEAKGQILNVVDDETPTQRQYIAMIRRRTTPRPKVIPVAYSVMRLLAGMASLTNKLFLGGRAKIPGIFIPARLVARAKPLRYTNDKIKRVLGWTPRYSLQEALDGSTCEADSRGREPAGDALDDRGLPPAAATADAPKSSRELRVGYMTGEYPRATDTFIQREVAALRERGVHVETFSIRKPGTNHIVGPEQRAERERTYYVLPPKPWTLVRSHAGLLFGNPLRYFSALRTALLFRAPGLKSLVWQLAYFTEAGIIASRIRQLNVTHLHNHFSNSSCSVAMLAAEMGGFSFSFTMHGPSEFYEPRYWQLDEKIRRARFVSCISHFCRSQAMVFSPQECWDKLHIVHCGVTPEEFRPVEHSGRGSRLLFVGRLAGVKGLPVLMDALATLRRVHPTVKLTIAGDGPDRKSLEARAAELGLAGNVEFLGYRSQQQVRELLGQTDVFVMASFAEGVPVVLMEAMAAGVPVVATRIAGIPELVENGLSGYLVPPGDPDALASRASELLADADLRRRMGQAGRAKVAREFNIATEAERLCKILTESLDAAELPISTVSPAEPASVWETRATLATTRG